MAAELNLQQKIGLEQNLSPQQRLSLEVLQTPLMELQGKIQELAEQNPMIEIAPSSLEMSVGDPISNALDGAERIAAGDLDEDERARQELSASDEWLEELPAPGGADAGFDPEQEKRRDFAYNSIAGGRSFQEYLLEQLRFADLSPRVAAACEAVIGSLDEGGFLTASAAEIAEIAGCTPEEAELAIGTVRDFDPPGIGWRTPGESLVYQLRHKGIHDEILEELVTGRLDDLARNQLPGLAGHFKISMEELKSKLAILRTLAWRPASVVADDPVPVVVPEFAVERRGDELLLLDNPALLPTIGITTDYDEILKTTDKANAEARRFLREKRVEAQQLIRSLAQRQTTLKRITEIIMSEQYDFFMRGPSAMRPLTMVRVSDKLDLHETTVSRAVSGKYLATPFGLWEYRKFFSGGFTGEDGARVASGSVKEKIRDMIRGENRQKPLSDDAIARLLKNDGLNVARRTVAKYRESMNIPASNLRREF